MTSLFRAVSIGIVSALIIGSASAFAQAPAPFTVGAVNLSYVARSSKAGKSGLAKIEEIARQKETEALAKLAALEKQQTELQKQSGLSPRAIADLQRAFEKSRVELERFQQDVRSELQGLQSQFEAEFRVKLTPIIDAISREKGLHFVFGLEEAAIVWWSPSVDISDEVVKRLDTGK